VLNCKHLLNALSLFTPTYLVWVKAHATSRGNNYVDQLAKQGALSHTTHGPFPHNTIPLSFLRATLRTHMFQEWGSQWAAHPSCRQTKLWFPAPSSGLSKSIISLPRLEIGRVIRWLTGHNFLRRHSRIVDPMRHASDKCRLCGRDSETSEHIIAECMALDFNRMETLTAAQLTPPYCWSLRQLLKFLAPIADILEDTSDHPPPLTILTRTSSRTVILDSIASPLDALISPSSSP